MKNFTIIAFMASTIILFSSSSIAQVNQDTVSKDMTFPSKGVTLLDADIGFSLNQENSQGDDVESYLRFDSNISGQYFISDNWSMGLVLGYTARNRISSSSVLNNEVVSSSYSILIGPIARYSFNPCNDFIQPYLQLSAPISIRNSKSIVDGQTFEDPTSTIYSFNMRAGLIFYPLDFLGIQLSASGLSWSTNLRDVDGDGYVSNSLNVDLLLKNWQLGVCFIF